MSVSVNSSCPSLEGCPKVFSNPGIARDPYVSISGINLSFPVGHLVTLEIHSLVEGKVEALVKVCFSCGCASHGASLVA